MKLTQESITLLKNDLTKSLMYFSNNKLSEESSFEIANNVINNINWSNQAIQHKGINWLAKDILNRIKY